MNQSIRPLPFAPASEQGTVEGASFLLPKNSDENVDSNFDELLDSQVEETEGKSETVEASDAWALYGHVQSIFQVLQQAQALPADAAGSEAATAEGSGETSGELIHDPILQNGADLQREKEGAEATESSEEQVQKLVESVRPAQQKIPSFTSLQGPATEQIAANSSEPAKKTSGIPAAQAPPMLLASQKQEESAPKQKSAVSEENFGTIGLEAARPKNDLARESTPPKRDLELADISIVDAVTPEWSSFEGISETTELQEAPRAVESIELAEAIRTHVEVLKTGGREKLDVVLRPDGQTQLLLHVEKVNGQILVQARCERGDFARLEANWTAVQQSLANQGIRVEALQQSANFQQSQHGWSNSSSSQQQSGSDRDHQPKIFEQEFPVPTRPKKITANGGAGRGWQSWA